MTKKLMRPVERCPFCGEEFCRTDISKAWWCICKNHTFYGPYFDPHGRKIDRVVRQMRKRMAKEMNNA